MKQFPENFCILPWVSAVVPPTGGVGVCCVSSSYRLDEGMEESKLGLIRQNQTSKEMRRQFLNGEWPKGCDFCKRHSGPENRGHDMRRMNNERYRLHEDYKLEDFTEEPLDLIDLEINFGNICNFKCRMCSSNNSSRWITDAQLMQDERFQPFKDIKVNKGEFDVAQLIPYMKKLKLLQVKGGEPFLHPKFKKLLQELVNNGTSKTCSLYVISNGSIQDPELLDLVEQFQQAHIAVSIDGLEPVYSYIRDGSSGLDHVTQQMKNITDRPNIYLSNNFTLQIYNMLQVYEVTKFFSQYTNHIILLPVMQDYLHFRNAPQAIKDEAEKQLERVLAEIKLTPDSYQRYFSALQNIREPRSEAHWQDFITYTKKLDQIRNQDFLKIEPRFKSYFPTELTESL